MPPCEISACRAGYVVTWASPGWWPLGGRLRWPTRGSPEGLVWQSPGLGSEVGGPRPSVGWQCWGCHSGSPPGWGAPGTGLAPDSGLLGTDRGSRGPPGTVRGTLALLVRGTAGGHPWSWEAWGSGAGLAPATGPGTVAPGPGYCRDPAEPGPRTAPCCRCCYWGPCWSGPRRYGHPGRQGL